MTIKVTKTGDNYYQATGKTAGEYVGIFLIIMFCLFAAVLAVGGSFMGGAVMLMFVSIIAAIIGIRHKSICQKKINEFAAKEKTQEQTTEFKFWT